MGRAATPQEQRRFLLALACFRERKLVDRSLALALTDAVPTQDVIFLVVRMLSNPASRERSWSFVKRASLIPTWIASRSTPQLTLRLPRRSHVAGAGFGGVGTGTGTGAAVACFPHTETIALPGFRPALW